MTVPTVKRFTLFPDRLFHYNFKHFVRKLGAKGAVLVVKVKYVFHGVKTGVIEVVRRENANFSDCIEGLVKGRKGLKLRHYLISLNDFAFISNV